MSAPFGRRLQIEDIGDVTVVTFIDKKFLDEQMIELVGEKLFSLVEELGRLKIVLNLGMVEYLSPSMLGKMITLRKKVEVAKGKLILCSMDPQIYEVFEITKLNKVFHIEIDEQYALREM